MGSVFAEMAAILVPVLTLATIGFYLFKSGQDFDTKALTPLIVNITTPAMVVHALLSVNITLGELGEMAVISIIMQAIFGVFGYFLLRYLKWSVRTYLPVLMLPNNGNLGLPLCFFAFGEPGMALGVAFFAILPLSQFTIGQAIAAGQVNIKSTVKNPIIWALGFSFGVLLYDITLPLWMLNSLELTGSITIPIMLVTLGISLAKLTIASLPRALFLSSLRVFGGIVLGFLMVEIFELSGVAAGVVMIQSAMPSAVFNYLFANLYDNQPEEVAGVIVVSSLLSFVTLPILLPFLI